ncbi:MAG: hypothetical protein ACTHK0_17870 [Ginsengibacter sp.]
MKRINLLLPETIPGYSITAFLATMDTESLKLLLSPHSKSLVNN